MNNVIVTQNNRCLIKEMLNIDQQHYLDFVVLAADVFCLTN